MSKKISKEEWFERFIKKHGNKYDYSLVKEINSQNDIISIKCLKHNIVFQQRVIQHATGTSCIECSRERKQKKKYTTETFIQSLPENLKKYNYDYSKVSYKGTFEEVTVVCPKHGDFSILATKLLQGHKCRLCVSEENSEKYRLTTEKFIEKCKIKYKNKDYDYSITKYGKNAKDEILIKCPNCGIVKTTPLKFLYGYGCDCEKYKFKGEEKIAAFLDTNKIKYKREKTFEDLILKKELRYDFFLSNYNLLIEYNGKQHYENLFKKPLHEWHEQLHHDWVKRKYALKNNIKLLIIPYWEYNNIEKILSEDLL